MSYILSTTCRISSRVVLEASNDRAGVKLIHDIEYFPACAPGAQMSSHGAGEGDRHISVGIYVAVMRYE